MKCNKYMLFKDSQLRYAYTFTTGISFKAFSQLILLSSNDVF